MLARLRLLMTDHRPWALLGLAALACAAGCGEIEHGPAEQSKAAPRDFVRDAIEGAALANMRLPAKPQRLLFSTNSGDLPTSGGERNTAFLNVAAQSMGFPTVAFHENDGDGLALLRVHGVQTVSSTSDDFLRQLPAHLPRDAVRAATLALAQWRAHPNSKANRGDALRVVDELERWALSAEAAASPQPKSYVAPDGLFMHALRLRHVIQKYGIQTVIADGDEQALAALLARGTSNIRVVLYAQSAPAEPYDAVFAKNIEILACSDASAKRFVNSTFRGRVTILRNGVNTRRFAPKTEPVHALRDSLGLSADAFIIGHSGYLAGGKNQIAIVRGAIAASQAASNIHVVLAGGEGMLGYKDALETLARAHQFEDHLHFLGLRDDIDAVLKEFDLYVFPSRHEGFGLGLAEAMATAVPAIASDLDAFHEFTGDTVELIGPIDDNIALPAAILHVIQHPQDAKERALRSRQQIIELGIDTDRMIQQFAAMLGATRVK